jgi:hypothetical protein
MHASQHDFHGSRHDLAEPDDGHDNHERFSSPCAGLRVIVGCGAWMTKPD